MEEEDLNKPQNVYYLPMQVGKHKTSTTRKIRTAINTSTKTTSKASFNDQLLVRPTVHSSLINVLLPFGPHKVALATDISRMYCAVLFPKDQRHLHCFVLREDPHHSRIIV